MIASFEVLAKKPSRSLRRKRAHDLYAGRKLLRRMEVVKLTSPFGQRNQG